MSIEKFGSGFLQEHSCIIGFLMHYDWFELVTLDGLKKHMADRAEYNKNIDNDKVLKEYEMFHARDYNLKDYGDKRFKTDLSHFTYCPICGKTIDWEKIRKGERNDS